MALWNNPPYYLTAYGLAVKHGFVGSEKQWLESLKGEPGTGLVIVDSFDTYEELVERYPSGITDMDGFCKVGTSETDYLLYYWDATDREWKAISIIGPQGPRGDSGDLTSEEIEELNRAADRVTEAKTAAMAELQEEAEEEKDAVLGEIQATYEECQEALNVTAEQGAASAAAAAQSAEAAETAKQYAQLYNGAPRQAATAAGMTDHSLIYVYTGSEEGYTSGNWYYWNGTAWASGGVYNSVAFNTDTTLSVSGAAADAKETGDQFSNLESAFNIETHNPANLLDRTAVKDNYYYWTDGEHSNTGYAYTGLIPVTPGQTIYLSRGNQTVSSGRELTGMRFLVGFGSDGTTVKDSASSVSASTGYTVPNDVYYIRISDSYIKPEYTYTMVQTSSTLFDFEEYFSPYQARVLKAECNNDPHIQSVVMQTIANESGKLIFTVTSNSLSANTNLICCDSCCNKKNEYIELTANFSTFDELTIAHGKDAYMGAYVTITASKIQCYSYNGTLYEEFEHGLTLSDFVNVIIYTKNDSNCRSKITIMTAGGDYTAETTRYYSCRAAVFCNATFAMTNVKMQYVVNDGKEDVWVFGDSYISLGDPQRWATQLVLNGHKNLFLCGYGGAMSANQIVDFRLMLAIAKPKYICWFLGMNDGDSSTAVNANWKTYVDEVLQTCDDNGIIPILATIPNCPNVINTFKNAYVKSLGVRYVDFAKAVNAESAGATWYAGMLSSDNTHPTTLGAKALMRQFLLDVPEVLYTEE